MHQLKAGCLEDQPDALHEKGPLWRERLYGERRWRMRGEWMKISDIDR
jgi:hypothetical protein